MVAPQALKVLRMKPHRKFCVLGELAQHVGWKRAGIVATLEAKRLKKSEAYHKNKAKKADAWKKALGDKKVAAVQKELAQHGF